MKQITDAMIDRHWAWNDPAYWDDDEYCEECGSANIEWSKNEDGTWDYVCRDCGVNEEFVEDTDDDIATPLIGKRIECHHKGEFESGLVVDARDGCWLKLEFDNGEMGWRHVWMCNSRDAV